MNVLLKSPENPYKYVNFFYNLRKYNNLHEIRNFDLIPQKSHKIQRIKTDSSILARLLRNINVISDSRVDNIKINIWE